MEEHALIGSRYRLIEKLGEGATKEVFRARDEMLDREVALCQFREHMLSDDYLVQVRREAQTLAELSHTNILGIFDFRDDDGWYMITEYLDGGSLKAKMDTDWKDVRYLPEALRITAEVADALAFTHTRGKFHRDVKPSNVILTSDGTAKLADFGMAKPFREESISRTGVIEGTVPYMSPEQARGHRPDSPADMYSFGIMLYEMVVGRRPYSGEDVSVLVKHLTTPPPPPTRFSPTCPPRLEKLLLDLLDKEPINRPNAEQTASELRSIRAEILGEETSDEPVTGFDAPTFSFREETEDEIPTEESLRNERISGSLQDPSTIVPLFFALLALAWVIFIPFDSSSVGLLIIAFLLLAVSAASFAWRYFGRYGREFEEALRERQRKIEELIRRRERRILMELRNTLREGFAGIDSDEGLRALNRLVNEFEQIEDSIRRWPKSNLLSLGQIPVLVQETYRGGLNVLRGVLELLMSVDASDKRGLEIDVQALETDICSLEGDESQAARLEIRKARLAEFRQRLEILSRQELRAEEFLLRTSLIEGELQRTRIELASLRVDSHEGEIGVVSEALQRTIDQAREVLKEMRQLGF